MKCVEVYKELYHQEPFDVAFCPYRISPLGAHIDHQYGKINGLAIDKGIHMAYHPKQNGVVELQSLNFPKRAQFFVNAVPEEKQGDWADHLRGAAKMLGEKYRLKVGLSGIIEGSLPIGGLSSSASVIICFLSALCKVNGIQLEPMEMILTAKAAENQYVGVSCGKLDQSCEVLSKKNHLLYLDTKDDSYELIPTNEKMKPYKVAIFFSGLERSLKNSKYNLRQDECKAAAYALMGYAGMDYDTFANTRLRDVPYEVFEAYKDRLPELWRRRAEHYYSEFARAEKGAELWRKGDLEGYGQLVFESGKSSMMMNLIAELSTGGKTPDGCKIGAPQKVIYQCSEDGVSDTIKPRLERCGADCGKIAFINEEVYNGLTLDDERIRQAIIEFRPRLVVIDPIQAYLGSDSDLQIAGRARKLMRRLGMWAAGYDCAIVLIGHLNKKEGSKGLYRSLGSIDVVAAARSVLQVERDTENPDIRIVHQIKNSLAPTAEDIRFSISADKGFRWLE